MAQAANQLALSKVPAGEWESVKHLLDSAELFLSGASAETALGVLATTLTNQAFVALKEGQPQIASRLIERVNTLESKDSAGQVLTKLNKVAVLAGLGTYREAYLVAKEVLDSLPSAKKTAGDLAAVQVRAVAQLNVSICLEALGESPEEAAEARAQAVYLCETHLGQHPLKQILNKPEGGLALGEPSHDVGELQNETLKTVWSEIPKEEDHEGTPVYKIIESLDFRQLRAVDRVLRLPHDSLPIIPTRSFWARDLNAYLFSVFDQDFDPRFLLNPAVQYFSKQAGQHASQQYLLGDTELTVFCVTANVNGADCLHISLQGQPLKESISFADFSKVCPLLEIQDVLSSRMTLQFVRSFEDFSRILVFPFLRIVTDYRRKPEKVEMWSQPKNLLVREINRVFLNACCKVTIAETSDGFLRGIISEIGDEEYFDRCVRFDLVLDQTVANSTLTYFSKSDRVQSVSLTLKDLEPALKVLETCVGAFNHSTFQNFVCEERLLAARVTLSGSQFDSTVWIVRELRSARLWEITAAQESHTVTETLSYLALLQIFGMRVSKLSFFERKVIAFHLLESLTLVNAEGNLFIQKSPIYSLINKRYYLEDFSSITLSLIGTNQSVIGIKATKFNISPCLEQGCLICIDVNKYKKSGVKADTEYESLLQKVQQETVLVELLTNSDKWQSIRNALKVEETEVYLEDYMGNKAYLDTLEYVLSRE